MSGVELLEVHVDQLPIAGFKVSNDTLRSPASFGTSVIKSLAEGNDATNFIGSLVAGSLSASCNIGYILSLFHRGFHNPEISSPPYLITPFNTSGDIRRRLWRTGLTTLARLLGVYLVAASWILRAR